MKNLIFVELKRAFTSVGLLVSLTVGALAVLLQFISNAIPIAMRLKFMTQHYKPMTSPEGLFFSWLGGSATSMFTYIFYLLIPLLVILPHGDSLYTDLKYGYAKQILLRSNRQNYVISKSIAVFLSAGCVVAIPLIVSLLITSAVLPAVQPQLLSALYAIRVQNVGYELFYSYPFIYSILYILFNFIFAGILGLVAQGLGFVCEHRITVIGLPALVIIFIDAIANILQKPEYSPIQFMIPGTGVTNVHVVVLVFSILICFATIPTIKKGIIDDVF